ncbi:antibiotic ABC transporter [uncultured Paracoccus sp.]|nr:antibiotic ABC transporter [uncultured Paracoccus sp.]
MNKQIPDPMAQLALWAQMARIGFESQLVIGMRLAGMMGIVSQSPDETLRMFTEKYDAAQEAFQASIRSVTRGDSVDKVMSAALRPYARRTKANSRRLARHSGARR